MQVDPAVPSTSLPAPHLSEACFHEPSDPVRFQVAQAGAAVNASVSRQPLRHHFGAGESQADHSALKQRDGPPPRSRPTQSAPRSPHVAQKKR